jgi:NAD-dependent dihydropyrimidine dehydrogenase PreA subunit
MTQVNVDQEKCTGCGDCVDSCPVAVFELQEVEGETKSVPVNVDDCILCRVCEIQCPEQAIEVIED